MNVIDRGACERVLTELALFFDRTSATSDVEVLAVGLRVTAGNVDLLLRPVDPGSDVVNIRWTVTVREPYPSLGTWWTEWTERHAGAADILHRLECAEREVDRLLSERASAVMPLPVERALQRAG